MIQNRRIYSIDPADCPETIRKIFRTKTEVISAITPNAQKGRRRALISFKGEHEHILLMLAAACQIYANESGVELRKLLDDLAAKAEEFEIQGPEELRKGEDT